MNHNIHLLLKAGQSRSDMVKSFKATPLVWDYGASFGLKPCFADFIDYVKDSSKFNNVIGFDTTLHKFPLMNCGLLHISALTISHQLILDFFVFKLIINLLVASVSWIVIRL